MRASERERAKELDRQSEGKLRELKFAAFEYHKMHTYTYVCKYTHAYMFCIFAQVLFICTFVVMPNTYANCNLHSFIKYYYFTLVVNLFLS